MVCFGGGLPNPDITGVNGDYGFPGLVNGANYTVTPEKDVDPLNGVTTYDLVLMSKHILGIEPPTSTRCLPMRSFLSKAKFVKVLES